MAEKIYRIPTVPPGEDHALSVVLLYISVPAFIATVALAKAFGTVVLSILLPLAMVGILVYLAAYQGWVSKIAPKKLSAVRVTDSDVILEFDNGAPDERIALADLQHVELDLRSAADGTLTLDAASGEISVHSGDAGVLWSLRKHLETEIYARKVTPRPPPIVPAPEPPSRPRSPAAQLGRMSHTRTRRVQSSEAEAETQSVEEEVSTESVEPPRPSLELKPEEAGEAEDEAQRWRSI